MVLTPGQSGGLAIIPFFRQPWATIRLAREAAALVTTEGRHLIGIDNAQP